jgi:hypothetical protein
MSWKLSVSFLLLVNCVNANIGFLLAHPVSPSLDIGNCSNTVNSSDWAGYVVSSDFQSPQPIVTGVNASWRIPRIKNSSENTYSAMWVGIGGFFDDTLIQAGSTQAYVNNYEIYTVWYELLPAEAITIAFFRIRPGDEMAVAIQLVNSTSNLWSIDIYDRTSGGRFTETFTYASSQLSAEWIVERPEINGQTSILADFGNVTFLGSHAMLLNQTHTIRGYPFNAVSMATHKSVLATASPLSDNGATFTVKYIARSSSASYLQPLIIIASILGLLLVTGKRH